MVNIIEIIVQANIYSVSIFSHAILILFPIPSLFFVMISAIRTTLKEVLKTIDNDLGMTMVMDAQEKGLLYEDEYTEKSILKYDFNCAGNEVSLDADKENV